MISMIPKIKAWAKGLQQDRLNEAYNNGYHWVMAMRSEGVTTQEILNHVSESIVRSEKDEAFDRGTRAAITNLVNNYPSVKGNDPRLAFKTYRINK